MVASLDELRWRSSLPQGSDVPEPHDLLRAAEIYRGEGFDAEAHMLRRIAEVIEGFSPQHVALRAGEAMPAGDRETVKIAITELQLFAREAASRIAAALVQPSAAVASAPARHSADDDIARLIANLHGFFADPTPPAQGCDALVARVDEVGRSADAIDFRRLAGAPLPSIASAMMLAAAQEFVLANRSLLHAPLGGAALAHHAARFDNAGLGPYFSNLRLIAHRSRDVFELAAIARRAGLECGADVPAVQWVVLISQRLGGALRDEIVDDLGDLGAMTALSAILDRTAGRPDHRTEIGLIMRLRDAALDNGDHALGARAQGVIVRLRPDSVFERRLLGEIDGTAGRIAAAEQSFCVCLRMSPGDPAIVERLEALQARAFARFRIAHGWVTPPGRLVTRLRRRQGARIGAQVETRRAVAVEL